MRHRLLVWATAASMVAGLAAAAATFGIVRHVPADLRLTAVDDDRAAPAGGIGAAAGDPGDGTVGDDGAGAGVPADGAGSGATGDGSGDALAAMGQSVLITPMPLGDLASRPDSAAAPGAESFAAPAAAAPDEAGGAAVGTGEGTDGGETVVVPDASGAMAGDTPTAVVTSDPVDPAAVGGSTAALFDGTGNASSGASIGGGGGGCGSCGFGGGTGGGAGGGGTGGSGTGAGPGSGGTSGSGGGTGAGGIGSGTGTGGGSAPSAPVGPGSGTTVPEPATWLLLTTGFGLVGAARRRYRSVSTAASTASTLGRTL